MRRPIVGLISNYNHNYLFGSSVHQMGSVINRIQLIGGEVSRLGAHTCVSPLTLGLTNQSKRG